MTAALNGSALIEDHDLVHLVEPVEVVGDEQGGSRRP